MALTYSVIKHNWNIIHEFKALPKILFSIGRHYTIGQDSYRIDFFGEHSQGSSGKKRCLFSKAGARRFGSEPEPDPQSEENRGDLSRRLAISMPYLDTKIDALVPTYHCKACARQSYSRMKIRCYNPGCPGCQRSLPNGVDVNDCGNMDGVLSCKIEVAHGRLYTPEEMLAHFVECDRTQEVLGNLVLELHRPELPSPKKARRRKRR